MIDPIQAAALADTASAAGTGASAPMPMADRFMAVMEREIAQANSQMVAADTAVQQLAAGEPVALHEVMLQLEQAKLGFQTLVAFRNKILEAYQEVMRMQV